MDELSHRELLESLDSNRRVFICCASFEGRSKALPLALVDHGWDRLVVFYNRDIAGCSENAVEISQVFGECSEIHPIAIGAPLDTGDTFSEVVAGLSLDGSELVVDISTFTHEHLLVLVRVIRYSGISLNNVEWIYCRVKEYSYRESGAEKWLSRGVYDIRSVLGYSGSISPQLPTALLVLVGFEAQRASNVIDAIEPSILLLGKGASTSSESAEFFEINDKFHRLVRSSLCNFDEKRIHDFVFPCNDAESVATAIDICAEHLDGVANLVVVPMNTKISTLGVAWAFDRNPRFQIVYAQAFLYNFRAYSQPSDRCYRLGCIFDSEFRDRFETYRELNDEVQAAAAIFG